MLGFKPKTVPITVADIQPGCEFINRKTGGRVTVNYVQPNKVNYALARGSYSMLPEDFVKYYGKGVK